MTDITFQGRSCGKVCSGVKIEGRKGKPISGKVLKILFPARRGAMPEDSATGKNAEKLVSIVIVHWNSERELSACIDSIVRTAEPPVEVIVVDNASVGIESLPWSEYPDFVRLIRNRENEGYARATNQGLRESRGGFVLLLNPDTVLNGRCVRELAEALSADPAAGAATGRLDSPDGSFQRYYSRFPTLAALAGRLTVLEPLMRNSAAVRSYLMLDMNPDEPRRIEQAPGACLLLKRNTLDETGPMDERFPLFFNDVDFCRRLRGAAREILYVPAARFTHRAQSAVGRMDPALRRAEMRVSAVRYFAKHHGAASAAALKWILAADLLIRQSALAARCLAGKRGWREFRSGLKGISMLLAGRSLFD